ncbi:MAG: tRNA (adenosine(37)-N6)-threonylcarbamoyltransferase complex dimerization subunit type 1 TsaB [Vampirovibrionales bacterium]|jgi:tRNA threonylcarbamoyl adenosine modification protein YeaZ
MKTVLCVDTSHFALHFALFEAETQALLFRYEAPVAQQWTHSALLVPLLQDALAQSQTTLDELSRVYLNVGPGSFTGLRASLSMVRCLGQFLPNLELYAVNGFQWQVALLELNEGTDFQKISVGLDARRVQQYNGVFHRNEMGTWQASRPPSLLADERVFETLNAQTLYLADASVLGRYSGDAPTLDESTLVGDKSLALWQAGVLFEVVPTSWQALDALYLQEPSITPNPNPPTAFVG